MHRHPPVLLVAALLLGTQSCRSTGEALPLTPPALERGLRYFPGTVLSGVLPEPGRAAFDPDQALDLRCEVTYIADLESCPLGPISAAAALNVSSTGDDPLLPVPELAIDTRVGWDRTAADYARDVQVAPEHEAIPVMNVEGVLPPGVTAAFYAESIDVMRTEQGQVVRKLASVLIGREPGEEGQLSAALLVEDIGQARRGPNRAPGDPAPDDVLLRQLVLLEHSPEVGGDPLVFTIPSPFESEHPSAFVVSVRVESPAAGDDPERVARVDQCREALEQAATAAADIRIDLAEAERITLTLQASLRALDLAEQHRPALVFLAGTTRGGAPLSMDLALSGEPATLAAWAQLVGTATDSDLLEGEPTEALEWVLERSAYELLARQLDQDLISDAERARLTRYAGQAGVFPGILSALLDKATGLEDLRMSIEAENLFFLESADPSARVRAYDWLAARGAAPAAFDPLASRARRRSALAAFQRQQEREQEGGR